METGIKALFAHDHYFSPLDGEIYSESQFPATLWQRYLRDFDSLTIFAREGRLPAGKKKAELERSSTSGVSFVFGPNLSSPIAQLRRRGEARRRLHHCLQHVDAVIARLPSELGLVAIDEAKRAGLPWAIELVGCPRDALWNYGSWQGKAYAPVMAARTRLAVREASFVLYVTQEFLQRRYPNYSGVSIGCSNVEIFKPTETILRTRIKRIHRQDKPLILGLIGTLKTRYKGIHTIFEAMKLARDRLPPVQFRILAGGDQGPWRAEAASYGVDGQVLFDGTLPAGEPVLNWLDNVDVYLQPSFTEGLPRALIEALSRGCPAIASTCAGIPELLDKECLIQPGDAKHLAELLIKAATSYDWQERQAARNWSEAGEYSRDKLEYRRQDFWSRFAAHAAVIKQQRKLS